MTKHTPRKFNGWNLSITKLKRKIIIFHTSRPRTWWGPQLLEPPNEWFCGAPGWYVLYRVLYYPFIRFFFCKQANIRIPMNPSSGFNGNVSQGFVSPSAAFWGLQLIGHKDSVWSLQHHAHLPVSQAVLPENRFFFWRIWSFGCWWLFGFSWICRGKTQFESWTFIQFGLRLFGQCIMYLSKLGDIYIRYTVHIT